MEPINFHNIANITCSKKEIKEDDDKIFIYSNDDESDNIPQKQNKNQFNDVFERMRVKLQQLSENASDIIKNKKFSNKTLLEKYSNIQAYKTEDDWKKKKFRSINELGQINNNNGINNITLMNINKNDNKNINNVLSSNDLNIINSSKSSNSSFKNSSSLTEKKRKRQNSINSNKEDNNKIFNDILNICQKISNIQDNIIKINKESNELYSDNENTATTIISHDKEIATIYLNENIIQKIHIIKTNKMVTEEKEISDCLKKIKRELNKKLNKLTKNKY